MKKLLLILGIGLLSLTGCNQVDDNLEMVHQHEWYQNSYYIEDYDIKKICDHYNQCYENLPHHWETTVYFVNEYYCLNCNAIKHNSLKEVKKFDTRQEAKDYIHSLLKNQQNND